jgi:hypothetical protein
MIRDVKMVVDGWKEILAEVAAGSSMEDRPDDAALAVDPEGSRAPQVFQRSPREVEGVEEGLPRW